MKLHRSLSLALALGLALAGCTGSDTSNSATGTKQEKSSVSQLERAKKLVTGASQGQAQADSVFEGPEGMVGVVITPANAPGGEKAVVWMSPEGSMIFLGAAFNEAGENLNVTLGQEHMGKAGGSQSADLLNRVVFGESGSFVQGKSGPIVTVIVDLNCSHCNTFFSNAQPLIDSGKLRVRYVLAGFLTQTSGPKAAAVLGAKDKVAALKKAEADYAKNGQRGPAPTFKPEFEDLVKANNDILRDTGEPATPYVFYCDKQTQEVVGQAGAPEDLESFLEGVGSEGHPGCSK